MGIDLMSESFWAVGVYRALELIILAVLHLSHVRLLAPCMLVWLQAIEALPQLAFSTGPVIWGCDSRLTAVVNQHPKKWQGICAWSCTAGANCPAEPNHSQTLGCHTQPWQSNVVPCGCVGPGEYFTPTAIVWNLLYEVKVQRSVLSSLFFIA